jgi:D-glycero-alpha-D-manno-heptose 1-phosphate guanylyltransferase
MAPNSAEYPVLVLAGGLGSRLSVVVNDRPKILAPVAGRAFIDILLEKLVEQGFRRFVLSVGHLKEKIYQHFESHALRSLVTFCPEGTPLGTGGAIWQARRLLETGPFLALNGDSHCDIDFGALISTHHIHHTICTLVVVRMRNRRDFGTVLLEPDGRISQFSEKSDIPGEGWINAGIYLFEPALFSMPIPAPAFSLEKDFLPWLVTQCPIFGFRSEGELVDIGTPERLRQAQELFRREN